MFPRPITHQNIFRVLIAGFALVMILLLAAAIVGVRNIGAIQQNARSLLREQSVTNGLIDELHRQQTSLSEVFSILARDPDSVDYDRMIAQLDGADRDIQRISAEGAQTPEAPLWERLRLASNDFSGEARRLLAIENPQTYATLDLFRDQEAFISVVARLIEAEYHKVSTAQSQIDQLSSRLRNVSLLFASLSVALALVFAVVTVRLVSQLTHAMEWQTAELGRVSWHLLDDQEAVARRFSHELHDELGQALTAIKTNLNALDNAALNHQRLADCLELVDGAIGNVRQMSQLLRPTILDDFGLEAGIRWLADNFSTRTGIHATLDSNLATRLPDETETHLFRIAQEALTNIARHSGATHVAIKIDSRPGEVCLSIHDDGRGMNLDRPASPPPASPTGRPASMGMVGMRARARSAGGDLTVSSQPDQGVLIEVRVPVHHETNSHSVS